MTIIYRNQFKDRVAFIIYHLSRNPLTLVMTIGVFLFFTFESVIPAVQSVPVNVSTTVKVIVFIFAELLIAFILIALQAILVLVAMVSRRNKPLYCERKLTVEDDVFITESEYGRSETKWSIVQKLIRTRTHIFIYLAQESAVIVPRRAFENATQWDAFYEICRRKTNQVRK